MRVTERLASLFIEENLRDREMLAEGTNQFLTAQLEDARRRLDRAGEEARGLPSAHAGELPSQAETNLQKMQNVQMQIQRSSSRSTATGIGVCSSSVRLADLDATASIRRRPPARAWTVAASPCHGSSLTAQAHAAGDGNCGSSRNIRTSFA